MLKNILNELNIIKTKALNPIKAEDLAKQKKEITWSLKHAQQLENPFYIIKSSPWPTIIGLSASYVVVDLVFNVFHAESYTTRKILDKVWTAFSNPNAADLDIVTPVFNFSQEITNPLTFLIKFPAYLYNLVVANCWSILSPIYAIIDVVSSFIAFQVIPTLALVTFLLAIYGWFKDMVIEGTFEGRYTSYVQWNIKCGFLLFILSEIMVFVGLFWSYFFAALSPTSAIGGVWPPKGVESPDPLGLPLLNTLLLLYSGLMVNISLKAIRARQRTNMLVFLFLTIALGSTFEVLQICEYCWLKFCISDSVYGSAFYMTTGAHGLHVLVGLIWLTVCFIRAFKHHFRADSHLNIKLAAWYWHFVDIVWILVYLIYYWWT